MSQVSIAWEALAGNESAPSATITRSDFEAVIAAAMTAERAWCAARLEAACANWPDNPQVRAVLRSHAAQIREGAHA